MPVARRRDMLARILLTMSITVERGLLMKILLWIIAIIFIVGLLTITGVFKLIF